MMSSTGETTKPLFLGTVDNNQLTDAEKQALLDNAVHEARWVDQDGKKRLACAACTKTFSDRGHLRTHYNTVHLKTMYKCTVAGCEEWFNSMRARQRHIQNIHSPKQPSGHPSSAVSPMRTVVQSQKPIAISSPYQQIIHTSSGPQSIRQQQPIIQQQQQQQTLVQPTQQTILQPQTTVHQQVIQQQTTIQAPVVQIHQPVQQVQHQIIQHQNPQQQQHMYQTQQTLQQQVIPQQPAQQQVIHQQQYFQQPQSQPLPQVKAMQQRVIHPQQTTVIQSVPQQTNQQTHPIQQQTQHVISGVNTAVVSQSQCQNQEIVQQTRVQLPSVQQQTTVSTVAQPFVQTTVYQGATTNSSLQSQQVVIAQQPSQCLTQTSGSQQPLTQVQVISKPGYTVTSQPSQCGHLPQQQAVTQQIHQQHQSVNIVEVGKLCPEHQQPHVHIHPQRQIQIQQQPQHKKQQPQLQAQTVLIGHQCVNDQQSQQQQTVQLQQQPQQHLFTANSAGSSVQVGTDQCVSTSSNANISIVGVNYNQTSNQQQNKLVLNASPQLQRRQAIQQSEGHNSDQHHSIVTGSTQMHQLVQQGASPMMVDQSCIQQSQQSKNVVYQHSHNQNIQSLGSNANIPQTKGIKRTAEVPIDDDAPPTKMVTADQAFDSIANAVSQEQDSGVEEDEFENELQEQKKNDFLINKQISEACLALIKRLEDMDINGYFAYPMTELTHRGCSTQLERLSDLHTMKKQVQLRKYHSLPGLQSMREELDLIFTNAMKYYNEKSPEYRLAARLWKVADEGAVSLISELTSNFPQVFLDIETSDVNQRLNCDGKSSLGFLQPDNHGCVGKKHRVRTIGEEVGRSANCVGPQPPLRDDRRNKIIPVTYLDYGSFSSFAPTYDSGAAYCTKEDSDLVLGEFGLFGQNDSCDTHQRNRQRQELVDETYLIVPEPELGDDFSLYLLNAFTKDILKEDRDALLSESVNTVVTEDTVSTGQIATNDLDASARVENGVNSEHEENKSDGQSLRSENICQNEGNPQQMLEDTATTLGKLREANYARLQQSHHRSAQIPAVEEQALADRVVASLAVMVSCNKPDDVISNSALHRSMNIELGDKPAIISDVSTATNQVVCGEA